MFETNVVQRRDSKEEIKESLTLNDLSTQPTLLFSTTPEAQDSEKIDDSADVQQQRLDQKSILA